MNCLTTTVINLGQGSIFAVNCLDHYLNANMFLNFRQQEEDLQGGGKGRQRWPVEYFTKSLNPALFKTLLHDVLGRIMTQHSLNAVCTQLLAPTLLAHSVFSLLLSRSCLNLTWSDINLSVSLTILLWDCSSRVSFSAIYLYIYCDMKKNISPDACSVLSMYRYTVSRNFPSFWVLQSLFF